MHQCGCVDVRFSSSLVQQITDLWTAIALLAAISDSCRSRSSTWDIISSSCVLLLSKMRRLSSSSLCLSRNSRCASTGLSATTSAAICCNVPPSLQKRGSGSLSASYSQSQHRQQRNGTGHPHFEIVLDKEACVSRLARNDDPVGLSDASKILLNSDVAFCRTFASSKVRTDAVQPAPRVDGSKPFSKMWVSLEESIAAT